MVDEIAVIFKRVKKCSVQLEHRGLFGAVRYERKEQPVREDRAWRLFVNASW